jgi:O-antigen/teichoic acid export membrane protein
MTLMFGDGYSAAGPTFVLLTGVALIVAVSVNFGNTMVAIGRERVFVVGTAIGAAVSVVTNFALIPILGAPGAAIGSIVAELCVLLYMLRRFQNSVAAVHWPLADLGIAVVITAVVSIGVILTLQAWGVIAALFVAAGGNAGLWYLSDLCSVRSALDWRRLSRGVT